MPKPQRFPVKFLLGITAEQDRAIDVWRSRQTSSPNRSEAVRRLLEIALKKERAHG